MGRSYCMGLGVLVMVVSGCGANEIALKKQTEMEARLEQVVQVSAADSTRIAQLTTELKDLQGQVAVTTSALDELKLHTKNASVTLEVLSRELAVLTPLPSSAKIEVVNRENTPSDKDSGQQQAYMKAFGLFSGNNYEAAIVGFETYLKTYPAGEYAGNAQYWIGECYYTQRSFREALAAFNRVVTDYPQGSKVPDAMLKIGLTLLSLNETDNARKIMQSLIDKYPKSQAAVKARERLNRH